MFLLILDWELGESREHLSARVLYNTNEEDRSQTENPIRQVINGLLQQGNRINSDTNSERESIEDAKVAEDGNTKLIESQLKVDEASHDVVPICFSFLSLSFLFP